MKLKDISQWETTQQTDNENKYIPGSSEKKRASMMYLFFGIFVSLSKKEFSPFELYHLKQAIGLWTLLLPIVLISLLIIEVYEKIDLTDDESLAYINGKLYIDNNE